MELPIELLNERMREMLAERERSHRKQFTESVKQVVRSLKSVEKAARNLEEATKRAWGRLSGPAEQHGVRLSEQVLGACESLASHVPEMSYDELRKFEERSLQTVRITTKAYNKYARSIIRSIKSETLILEGSIMDLSRSISDLSEALDKSELKEAQLLARDAEQLVQNAGQLRLKTEQIERLDEILKETQERQSKLQNDISTLSQDENLKELSRIDQLTKQRESEALALLEPLSKSLRKADRSDATLSSGSHKTNIGRLTEDPLNAMLEIPILEMRDLLALLRQLIEQGEIFLDQRRKRKSIEAVEVLEAGELERFRDDHSVLQANRTEILRQLRGSGIYDRWLSLQNQLESVRAETARCQNDIAGLQSQETRLRAVILADKAKIETALREIQNEQVSIVVSY